MLAMGMFVCFVCLTVELTDILYSDYFLRFHSMFCSMVMHIAHQVFTNNPISPRTLMYFEKRVSKTV